MLTRRFWPMTAIVLAFFILLWVAQGIVKGIEGCSHSVPQCPTEMQP